MGDLQALALKLGIESDGGLDTVMDAASGAEMLHAFEQLVYDGAKKTRDGLLQMHLALHSILEYGLWMYLVDANKQQQFMRQEDYLKNLADRCGIARSTIFEHRATLKVATHGLGIPIEEIADVGIRPFAALRKHLSYDRTTGEVTGFRNAEIELPDGVTPAAYAREVLEDVIGSPHEWGTHELDLTPKDLHRAFSERFSDVQPTITFWLTPSSMRGWELGYAIDDGRRGLLRDGDVPPEVVDRLVEKLRILEL